MNPTRQHRQSDDDQDDKNRALIAQLPDWAKLVIQVGGLLIAVGVLYQTVQQVAIKQDVTERKIDAISERLADFRLETSNKLIDLDARLKFIEQDRMRSVSAQTQGR